MTSYAEQLYSYMFRYESLLAENEELRERIAQMEDDARTADALLRENERLRQQLNLRTARTDFVTVDAYIISWDSNDWSHSFTINRGSNSGIDVGMCAITESGAVVGIVSEVGSNYAVIKSVLDSSLNISAHIVSSGYPGIVHGSYVSGQTNMLRMDYLPSAAVIWKNDQVVTAGSMLYPRNLILGHIVDAKINDNGIAQHAILEPAADFDSLEQVFIITNFATE
jgi:rod shape-determining protein MreC